ncbi:MAG: bacteriophage holin [Hyphomicrobiaceae bacterium]
MKLNIGAFALAFGIWWGVGIFIATWCLITTGAEPTTATLLNQIYVGYSVTPLGSVIGLAWGFVCGAVCGGILAWLYNIFCTQIGAGA